MYRRQRAKTISSNIRRAIHLLCVRRTMRVFEEESFVPMALLLNGKVYSVVTDQLSTPTEAYNAEGEEVWHRRLDVVLEERFMPLYFPTKNNKSQQAIRLLRFTVNECTTPIYFTSSKSASCTFSPCLSLPCCEEASAPGCVPPLCAYISALAAWKAVLISVMAVSMAAKS